MNYTHGNVSFHQSWCLKFIMSQEDPLNFAENPDHGADKIVVHYPRWSDTEYTAFWKRHHEGGLRYLRLCICVSEYHSDHGMVFISLTLLRHLIVSSSLTEVCGFRMLLFIYIYVYKMESLLIYMTMVKSLYRRPFGIT